MKTSLVNLSINPLTVIYIALSLYLGRFSFVMGLFMITIIHEFFHCFCALIFKIKTKSINILPIGCFAKLENFDKAKRYEQIIILLVGPLSYFFSSAIISFLYRQDIISIFRFQELNATNLMIMLFNLLPLEPLDGGKILKIILSSVFCEKIAIILSALIGLFVGSVVSIYLWSVKQYLFVIFIILNALINVLSMKKNYQLFLMKRLYDLSYLKYPLKINNTDKIYKYAHNYFIVGQSILPERSFLLKKQALKLKLKNNN